MVPISTEQLVARALDGDREASEQLVRKYFRAAYAVALAVTRLPSEAEDLAQEALLVAFQRLADCRDPARFQHWLLQIVRNRALNHLEHQRIKDAHASAVKAGHGEEAAASVAPGDLALRRKLVGALGDLSEKEREVVLLHDLEGWTHAEIADVLETTEGTSRQYLFQARRKLRATLGELQGEMKRDD